MSIRTNKKSVQKVAQQPLSADVEVDPMVASESRRRQAKTKSFDYYDYYDYSAALKLRQQQQALLNQGFANRQSLAATADLTADGTTAYGSFSHHGYHKCDNGISLGLLLTALLGIGVMFFTLFTKITICLLYTSPSPRD